MTRVILITGGGRGIGRATALLAGARGWSVGVNYVGNAEAAAGTVAAVEAVGGRAIAIRGDVSVEADVIAMFDATQEAFGTLDGLVNNAGIVGLAMPLVEMSAERMKRIFDVNIYGAYLCAREAARRLAIGRGGKGGAIVNVSSLASRNGGAFSFLDYAGSKGAINAMTIGLARELGPEGVRVNAVVPGLIDTEIFASIGQPDRAARNGGGTPLRRAGRAEEVAEAIIWLLSEAASYVNGALLDVTAGL